MAKNSFDLYSRYRQYSREKPKRNILKSRATPVVVVALLCAIAWQAVEFRNRGLVIRLEFMNLIYENYGLEGELAEIQDWLDDPANVAAYEEVLEKDAALSELIQRINTTNALTGRLAAYPKVDTALTRRIVDVGGESVQVTINGYNSTAGQLLFRAESTAAINAPEYVKQLEKLGLFQDVSYSGYSFNDGLYSLQLVCTLRAGAGREEG